MRVHLTYPPDPDDLARLRERVPKSVVITAGRDVPAEPLDVLVGGRPAAETFDAHPELAAFVIPFAGIPAKTLEVVRERPELPVFNLHHNAAAVAESAVGLLLAAARCVVPMDATLRKHDWRPRYEPDPGVLLAGGEAVVLGYGAIGRRVGRALIGLGMGVTGVRRRAPEIEAACGGDDRVRVVGADELDEALVGARALVVCVPSTDETRGMIDASRLARLGDKAVVVNVGRADTIDQDALYAALRDRTLHSAGLDVWWRYPADAGARADTAPADHPFEELDNVVLSPHRSGHHAGIEAERMEHLAALLTELARGQEPATRLDVDAGY